MSRFFISRRHDDSADASVRLYERLASLGFAVRQVGDPEFIIPPVVPVQAGEFLMGSDPRQDASASGSEQPRHRVALPAYQIGRFPVTVAEYACFARAGREPPKNWQSQLGKLDHPVVYVSWHDAVAYAAWLAERTGQPWRLPSEAEWEKAARWDGRTARIYPWGDAFDPTKANTFKGKTGGMTPVGSYPAGASPCGALDMAGNIWERTSSLFKPYPYNASDGRESAHSTENRALRGGSWLSNARYARAACRHGHRSVNARYPDGGFRLALAIPSA